MQPCNCLKCWGNPTACTCRNTRFNPTLRWRFSHVHKMSKALKHYTVPFMKMMLLLCNILRCQLYYPIPMSYERRVSIQTLSFAFHKCWTDINAIELTWFNDMMPTFGDTWIWSIPYCTIRIIKACIYSSHHIYRLKAQTKFYCSHSPDF